MKGGCLRKLVWNAGRFVFSCGKLPVGVLLIGHWSGAALAGEATSDSPAASGASVQVPLVPIPELPGQPVVFSDRPVSLSASAFRVVRMPGVDAELTQAGQVVPAVSPTVYLVLPATALLDPSLLEFGELRKNLSPDTARAAAKLLASDGVISALLRRQTEDVYTPTFDGASEWCSHAHYDVLVVSMALSVGEMTELRSMREDVSRRSVAKSACVPPEGETRL